VWLGTGDEFVLSATIWTLRFPSFSNVQENPWMRIPGRRLIGWAMQWKILAINHHNLSLSHMLFLNTEEFT
jgi:hypothetical protein